MTRRLVLRVEEDDLDPRVDLHGEIDEDAVLERRREHEVVAVLLDGPLDRGRRRLVLERARDGCELAQVGRVLPVVMQRRDLEARHVAHSLSPTVAS
jgi:hypothetical protein